MWNTEYTGLNIVIIKNETELTEWKKGWAFGQHPRVDYPPDSYPCGLFVQTDSEDGTWVEFVYPKEIAELHEAFQALA